MRRRALAWLVLAAALTACGHYGPPVRSAPDEKRGETVEKPKADPANPEETERDEP